MNLSFRNAFNKLIHQLIPLALILLSTTKLFGMNINPDSVEIGSVYLTRWFEDRKSAFTFSFDDGMKSHYINGKEILNQNNFPGTFNVLPPFLSENDSTTIWRYGTWPMFQAMSSEGHEISSHTLNHYYLTSLEIGDTLTEGTLHYELYQSKKMIEQRIPDKKCLSLAYPFSDRSSLVDSITSLYYESGRSAGLLPNSDTLISYYDLNSYVVHFSLPRNNPADDLDELYNFQAWTQSSINNGLWGMIMIHDVVPFSELGDLISQGLYEPMSNEWLTEFCVWLKSKEDEKNVWVETQGNIIKYLKERNSFYYSIISASKDLIEIEVKDSLENEIYDFPLSAYLVVPDEWNFVLSEQNSQYDTLNVVKTDSGSVVLAKFIPDDGNLKLTPLNINSVNEFLTTTNDFYLYQNYPNPFNPETKITWHSNKYSYQSLNIYDVLGKEVAVLVNEFRPAGTYEIIFDASLLPSGVYFYRLQADDFISIKKMILVK